MCGGRSKGFKGDWIQVEIYQVDKSFSQGYYVSFYLRSVGSEESMFEAKFNKIPAQLSSLNFVNINQHEPNVSLLKTLQVPVLLNK